MLGFLNVALYIICIIYYPFVEQSAILIFPYVTIIAQH